MPLPWDARDDRARIPNVAQRAITVKQLRDLRHFLQRLAKTGLLRNTSEFSRTNGMYGQPIQWEDIDLYHVTDEVIKRVIPHVDPEGERDPMGTSRQWYSWVEFVSDKPQPAKVLFSHWWGGRFKDFMATVDKLVLDEAMSINTTIWICTFAICQFGENFGPVLKDCPFIQALRTVELTVLVIDFQGGSLSRTWCGLEVHYTIDNEQELMLYTAAGRVGSSYVSGGPLVEMVKAWDIRRSEASDPPYRRQILNYVAGVGELNGLKRTSEGLMEVDVTGRPQFDEGTTERDPLARRRVNGEEEFAYESELFRTRAQKFEDLNMMVRLKVLRFLGESRKPKGCAGAGIGVASRGLTLGQLRVLTKRLEASCPWLPSSTPWWDARRECFASWSHLPFEALNDHHILSWVLHMTSSAQCSLMEVLAEGPQLPQFMVEHAGAQPWIETMHIIELFAQANQLLDSTVFWYNLASFNQHKPEEELQFFASGAVHRECTASIVAISSPIFLRRLWLWWSVHQMLAQGKNLFLGSKTGIVACNHPFVDGSWVCGHFDSAIAEPLSSFDIRDCSVAYEPDRARLFKSLQGDSREDWADRFNARVRCWAAGVILRKAAEADAAAEVELLRALPGLSLNSDIMRGSLGETPLHLAAAKGCRKMLRALLGAGVDPNVEDKFRERPLHYAAFAGCADMAEELLAAHADPWAENTFIETPLQVAKQSPAAFLGVDTSEVVALLSCRDGGFLRKEAKGREIVQLQGEVHDFKRGLPGAGAHNAGVEQGMQAMRFWRAETGHEAVDGVHASGGDTSIHSPPVKRTRQPLRRGGGGGGLARVAKALAAVRELPQG